MKRIYYRNLTLLVLLFFPIFLCCTKNNRYANKLTRETYIHNKDSIKVKYLSELSWQLRIIHPDSALIYANEAKSIADKIGFKTGIVTSLNRIGEIQRIQGNYNQAIATFNSALEMEKATNNLYGIARVYGQLTLLYTSIGQIEKASNIGQECIKIYKDISNLPALANAYDRQAVVYKYQGKFDKALNLTFLGMKIREQLKDSVNIIYSFINLANLYSKLLDYSKALEYNNKAMYLAVKYNDHVRLAKVYTNISGVYFNLKQIHTAIEYNFKSLEIKKQLKQEKAFDENYDNLGVCYFTIGKYDEAIYFYNKSIKLKEESGEKKGLSTVYVNIGNLYFTKMLYNKALFYYRRGLDIAKVVDDKLIMMELYYDIYKSYTVIGKFGDAVLFNNKYIALRDSLDISYYNATRTKERYIEEQGKNQLLEKDRLIKEMELKKKNIMIVGLLGILLLSVLLFFAFLYDYKLKQRTLMSEKNNKINEQKISELLKDQELRSMSAMLEGQEVERKRIAQDLHDRLGSLLSMVKLHFESVEDNIQTIREKNLAMRSKANQLLDEACEEVRKIANDLTSGVLNKFGLIPALRNLKESIEATGRLKIEVLDFGFDENRLEYYIEINLYRIIQELISNILRHSRALEVSIQLIKKEKRLNIMVEDNGIGFDNDLIKNKKGMGLKNIESRIQSLGGVFNIDSGKGAGTTVTIDIPLN